MTSVVSSGFCEEANTNEVSSVWSREIQRRLHGSASIDYRNGFHLRGVILSSTSCSFQHASLNWNGGAWGNFGGNILAASALDMTGCPIADRPWYTVCVYMCHYGYEFKLADSWSLDARAFRNWLVFHGGVGDIPTLCHWGGTLALKNPYVVPYGIFRWADKGQRWTYWELGLRRPFRLFEKLTLVPAAFVELGDGRHLFTQYGPNRNSADGKYTPGIMAMDVALHAEYALTDWLSLTAFIQEFITLNGDGRDALDRRKTNNALKDMTLFGVGVKLKF